MFNFGVISCSTGVFNLLLLRSCSSCLTSGVKNCTQAQKMTFFCITLQDTYVVFLPAFNHTVIKNVRRYHFTNICLYFCFYHVLTLKCTGNKSPFPSLLSVYLLPFRFPFPFITLSVYLYPYLFPDISALSSPSFTIVVIGKTTVFTAMIKNKS